MTAAIALLWGATLAPLTLLSVALGHTGVTPPEIGLVLAAANAASIIAAFLAGPIIERSGARRTLVAAFALAGLGIASLQLWPHSALLAALSSLVRGAGAGLFLVAGIVMVRHLAAEGQQIYRVGLFTSFVMLPTLILPGLAEVFLATYGVGWFFLLAASPAALALPLLARLPQASPAQTQTPTSYRALLVDRRIWLPCLIVGATGVMYAVNAGFLVLYLQEHAIAVTLFFTPFVALLLLSRFVLMRRLQTLQVELLIVLGMTWYTLPYPLLMAPSVATVVLAGGCFGLGYSIVFPASIDWLCRRFDRADQPKLISLINTAFQAGNVLGALAAGIVIATSWQTTLFALLLFGLGALLSIACGRLFWRNPKCSEPNVDHRRPRSSAGC